MYLICIYFLNLVILSYKNDDFDIIAHVFIVFLVFYMGESNLNSKNHHYD